MKNIEDIPEVNHSDDSPQVYTNERKLGEIPEPDEFERTSSRPRRKIRIAR